MVPPPAPASAPPAPAASPAPRTFSEHAENKMWQLKKDYATQVGSTYTGSAPGLSRTDCITYVRQVLEYAFEKVGEPNKVAGVRSHYQKGTELAIYLVGIGWSAYYWSPDPKNPSDGLPEHPVSFDTATRSKSYYTVPIKGMIVNYRRTPITPHPTSFWEKIAGTKTTTPLNDMVGFNKLSAVKFAYALARGGRHTFLLSYGMVYEVHWDKIGSDLYEASPFYNYKWLSGIVVIPPDAAFSL